jgi:hypothetical protein
MKKIVLILLVITSFSASAQVFSDGTVINSFSATDINNNVFSSTVATNAGQHFIIDISATWCGICWNYHNTKVLDDYYTAYGPNGTLAQDAEVLFYEGVASTNSNDLNGVGTNTVGDWVTGTNYLIFNEANPTPVKSSFANNGSLNYPTVFVVCSDRKMYRLATNIVNASDVRNFVNDKCGLSPLSTSTVHSTSFSYDVYPNPTAGNLTLDLHLDKAADINYSLFSTIGQKVISNNVNNQQGETSFSLKTSDLQAGMYILNLTVNGEKVTQKIIIQ